MKRISSSVTKIENHYDVVVIGSGYGGGVTASRMARAGKNVCVLERGKEILPGEFPNTMVEAASEFQVDGKGFQVGSETAMFDMHVNDEMNVLVGCGLGGTSLINANVSIQADPRVFEEPVWPKAFIADLDSKLKEGFTRAQRMLKPTPYPEDTENFPILKKTEAMRKCAQFIGEKTHLAQINVNFEAHKKGVNHVGVPQKVCDSCGDCVSGCNNSAKNTVQMTYLPDAKNFGAEIFTQTKVSYISQKDGKWIVHFSVAGNSSDKFDSPDQFVIADVVVLSAGSLGSTEILLRSKEKGLQLSNELGKNFTGNGDVVSFAYNTDQEINGIGEGTSEIDPENPPGPCITSVIDTRESSSNFRDGLSIEEGVLPGALAPVLSNAFAGLAALSGIDTDNGVSDFLNEKKRMIESFYRGAYHGAMRNTMTSLIMAHDSASGQMSLEDDKLRISWPGLGDEAIFSKIDEKMLKVTEALGGTYVTNPVSNKYMGNDQVTVHPLGGCNMGEDASTGVVNHKGQVFSSDKGEETYQGLYVADGSIIPMSLGTNPLFTITAIAERNAKLMANDYGWKYSVKLPSKPATEENEIEAEKKLGIQFTEVMAGYISTDINSDYETAYKNGKETEATFRFTLTVVSDDLDNMLENESHQAAMYGTVEAPTLSNKPFTVTNGTFNLFVKSEDQPEIRLMKYQIKMTADDGDIYFMQGYKSIRDDSGFDMWADSTTLFITVYKEEISDAQIIAKGLLKIAPLDFATQLTTMKVINAETLEERLKYTAKFGNFFAGQLFDTFGGVATGLDYFSSDAPPRKKRVLAAPIPEIYPVMTEDNVAIRLTRYEGGSKGPVVLAHGLGVSSKIFSMDTYETNLVEFLVANDYDVWLMDFRVSIELPVAQDQATLDQIAKYDFPASIDKVLEVTGEKTVQMIVHCIGAVAWTMGMLAGDIKNVRSAVVSQVSIYAKVPLLNNLKAGLYVPELLDKVGVDTLTAYVDKESSWEAKLMDKMLTFYPIEKEEQCQNPICRRITTLYGQLYEHDQLNTLTHDHLHEMYGIANIAALSHLGRIIRSGHVVTADGDDIFLSHLEQMKLPITFIGGAENEVYLPESLEETFQALKKFNGDKWYKKYSIPNYGHIDCIHGKNAARDVYPYILQQLEETLYATDLPVSDSDPKTASDERSFTTNLQPNLHEILDRIQKDDGHDYDFLCSQCESAFELIHNNVLESSRTKNIGDSLLTKIGFGDLAWILHLNNDYKDICESVKQINSLIPDPDSDLFAKRSPWPADTSPEIKESAEFWRPTTWKNWSVSSSNKLFVPNVSPEIMFASIQDSINWHKYYSNISEVSTKQLNNIGQSFTFRTFDTKFEAEIFIFQDLGEVLSIGWTAKAAFGTEIVQRWDMYPDIKGGSVVTVEQFLRGFKPTLAANSLRNAMEMTLQNWLYGFAVSAKQKSLFLSKATLGSAKDKVETPI